MNVSSGAAKVFKCAFILRLPGLNEHAAQPLDLFCSWFVNLSATAGFFTWMSINLTYIQFCTS
jgi:amino acid permease